LPVQPLWKHGHPDLNVWQWHHWKDDFKKFDTLFWGSDLIAISDKEVNIRILNTNDDNSFPLLNPKKMPSHWP
jgi:hypothetical protein